VFGLGIGAPAAAGLVRGPWSERGFSGRTAH
jgi:hypothetical protein